MAPVVTPCAAAIAGMATSASSAAAPRIQREVVILSITFESGGKDATPGGSGAAL